MTYLTSLKKYLHAKGPRLLGLSLLVIAGCSNPSPRPGSQFKGELELLVGDKGEFKLVNKGPGKVNLGQYTLSFRVAEAKDYDNNDISGLEAHTYAREIQNTQTGRKSIEELEHPYRSIEIKEKGIKYSPNEYAKKPEEDVIMKPGHALVVGTWTDGYNVARSVIECSLLDPAGKQIAQKRGNVWESRIRVSIDSVVPPSDTSPSYKCNFSIKNVKEGVLDSRNLHIYYELYGDSPKSTKGNYLSLAALSRFFLEKNKTKSLCFNIYSSESEEVTHVAIVVKNERFEVIGASEKKALLP